MRRLLAIALALLMVCALCGCGSAKSESAGEAYPATANSAANPGTGYTETQADGSSVNKSTAGGSSVVTTGSDVSAQNKPADSELDADKIIYSCDAEVETQDFDKTCKAVYALIDSVDGFLQSSSISGNYFGTDNARSADFVIRIPRKHFDEVTNSLSSLGNIPYCKVQAENITANYQDTESHLKAYQTEETRLLAMLEKAETVEDMLSIEDRLANVRYNIESLTSTLKNWDGLVSYSTLTLTVQEVKVYTETQRTSYWQSVKDALTRSLQGIGNFFKSFLRIFIALLPILAVLAVVAAIMLLVIKLWKKRRAKKHPPEQKP